MARIVCITAFVLSAAGHILGAPNKHYYHPVGTLGAYVQKPFPIEWRPSNPPKTETDVKAFEKYDLRTESFTIPAFVARYGIPQHYFVSVRGDGYNLLMYDLPSGQSVSLDVHPPSTAILAAAIRDSRGKLILLIK
jgi:hypothetical protein